MNKTSITTLRYRTGSSCPLTLDLLRVKGERVANLCFGTSGISQKITHAVITPAALREVIEVLEEALAEWDDATEAGS